MWCVRLYRVFGVYVVLRGGGLWFGEYNTGGGLCLLSYVWGFVYVCGMCVA